MGRVVPCRAVWSGGRGSMNLLITVVVVALAVIGLLVLVGRG